MMPDERAPHLFSPIEPQLFDPEAALKERTEAMAEANRTRQPAELISDEEADLRAENMENGSGFSPRAAREATHQVDVRDITSAGVKRVIEVRKQMKPPKNPKNRLNAHGKRQADGAPQHVRDEVRRARGY